MYSSPQFNCGLYATVVYESQISEMAGAVIENVSSRKLWTGGAIIFSLAVLGFVFGGVYITSSPNRADENIATEVQVGVYFKDSFF